MTPGGKRDSDWSPRLEIKQTMNSENTDTNTPGAGMDPADYARISREMMKFATESQALFGKLMKTSPADSSGEVDPLNVADAFAEASRRLWSDPARLMQANMNLWQQHMQLWQHATERLMNGGAGKPVAEFR